MGEDAIAVRSIKATAVSGASGGDAERFAAEAWEALGEGDALLPGGGFEPRGGKVQWRGGSPLPESDSPLNLRLLATPGRWARFEEGGEHEGREGGERGGGVDRRREGGEREEGRRREWEKGRMGKQFEGRREEEGSGGREEGSPQIIGFGGYSTVRGGEAEEGVEARMDGGMWRDVVLGKGEGWHRARGKREGGLETEKERERDKEKDHGRDRDSAPAERGPSECLAAHQRFPPAFVRGPPVQGGGCVEGLANVAHQPSALQTSAAGHHHGHREQVSPRQEVVMGPHQVGLMD